MASINNIVSVNATIETGGLTTRDFGITLFVTDDTTLPSDDTLRVYADLDEVAGDFAETSAPYLAAEVYFSQDPFPKNFMVGRWFESGAPAVLTGGTLASLATFQGITDGAFAINSQGISALDFSLVTSYADIATYLEAEIQGAGINVTVEYDSTLTAFVVTTVATGAAATLTYATSSSEGTDISETLAWTEGTASDLDQGIDAETISEAMERFQEINDIWYFITLDPAYKDTDTVLDLSTWVEAEGSSNPYMYFAESSDSTCLETDDTTSIFAQLYAQGSDRTAGDYTPAESSTSSLFVDNLSVSSAARLSSIDFDGSDSIINPAFKSRPLIDPSILTTSQTTELDRKRVNRYVQIGGGTTSSTVQNIYLKGYCFANGIWQDIRYGVDWLVNAVQVNVLDLLLEVDRVPQTIQGQALIKAVIETVCQQAIVNGLCAPGTVTTATKSQIVSITGNSKFNGTLPLGYLVYPQALSTLSESDRIERKLPPFYVWLKGSGAVNSVDINLYFDQ